LSHQPSVAAPCTPIFWNNRCKSARNGTAKAFPRGARAHLEKPACLRIDPRASLAIAALWSSEVSDSAATFLDDIKNLASQLDR